MREVQMKRVPHRLLIVPAAAALFAAAFGPISPANAQTFSSSYTSTAPKDCRTVGKPENSSTTQVCPGKSGLVVVISEDDLRQTVSVGPNRIAASKEPAAEAWFAPFNSTAPTVEWRAVDGRPFAITGLLGYAPPQDSESSSGDWLEAAGLGAAGALAAGLLVVGVGARRRKRRAPSLS